MDLICKQSRDCEGVFDRCALDESQSPDRQIAGRKEHRGGAVHEGVQAWEPGHVEPVLPQRLRKCRQGGHKPADEERQHEDTDPERELARAARRTVDGFSHALIERCECPARWPVPD